MNTQPTQIYLGVHEAPALRNAIGDVVQGVRMVHLWGMLGWHEIKQRYRRSVLGPLWLTLSTGIMVGTIGYLYSKIFAQPIHEYLPFLAVGLILWTFLSTAINEGCVVFVSAEAVIKQVKLPLTMHVCRLVWRNLIILAHNAIIILATGLIFQKISFWPGLASLGGLILVVLNVLWMVIVVGVYCARFRDIPPIVGSVLQIAFFLTPILWDKPMLGQRGWFAEINPFYHLIEVMRAPLLGNGVPAVSFGYLILMAILGWGFAIATLSRFRARVPYWV